MAKHRKMPKPHFLLPPPIEAGGEGRFSARPEEQKLWSPPEDAVLFPAIFACQNEYSYRTTCRALCEVLGREPAYANAARPPLKTILADCVALIERRTVTHTLSGTHRDTTDLFQELNDAEYLRDADRPTFGEFNKVLVPYRNKVKAGSPAMSLQEFVSLTMRSTMYWEMCERYVTFSGTYPPLEDGPSKAPNPGSPKNRSGLQQCINEFLASDGWDQQRSTWANYLTFLTRLE